nr:hypothetical protein [Tanacetum cinerariifolium]
MMAILEKYEHNQDFHQIVDFIEASHIRQYTKRTRIAYSTVLPPVADNPASPLGDDSQGEACLTDSGLEAEQDRANITNTSTLPNDSTPRAASRNGFKNKCSRVGNFLVEGQGAAAAERSTERGSDDTEEMVNVLTSLDAAKILTSGGVQVSISPAAESATATVSIHTSSGSIPIASPHGTGVPSGSGMVPTASLIFTTATESIPYTRKKEKEKMVESDTPKKKRLQEQIDVQFARELEEEMARDAQRMNEQVARDAEIVRIHAEEELQMMIDGLDMNNETITKYLQEYHQFAAELPIGRRVELISDLVKYQDNYAKVLKFQTQQRKPLSRKQQKDFYMSVFRSHTGWKAKHFKGMTLEEIKEKFDPVWKQIQDFIPIVSKEESERFKRKEIRLEQDSAKKLKTLEEVPEE